MKKITIFLGSALLIGSLSMSSCSKEAKKETSEATEAVKEDVKDAAASSETVVKDAASDVASDVKGAASEATSAVKDASGKVADAVDSKLSGLSKATRMQYDALDNEIKRIDGEIEKAVSAEKAKLQKTRATLVAKRDELLK